MFNITLRSTERFHKDGRLFALERGRSWWALNQKMFALMQRAPMAVATLD